MRGWIYVTSAHGDPGHVRIGESAVDPRQGVWRAQGGDLHYDALVDAPRATVDTVHARLRPLCARDGLYRCSPEFAVAAIHHALGGPPPGERLYDTAYEGSRAEPLRPVARRGERGGSTASVAIPAVGTLVAIAVAAWMASRTPVPVGTLQRDSATLTDTTHSTQAAPAAAKSSVEPEPAAAANPPTAGDCAALESILTSCAARRGRACEAGAAAFAARERRVMQDMQRSGRTFDAAALENFCRAACRHGYRPAHADFAATVCRAP